MQFTRTQSGTFDFLFEVYSGEHGRIVVHMEFQSSNDNRKKLRMLRYAMDILMEHDLPLYQSISGAEPLKMS
jgi:hypothetical protein